MRVYQHEHASIHIKPNVIAVDQIKITTQDEINASCSGSINKTNHAHDQTEQTTYGNETNKEHGIRQANAYGAVRESDTLHSPLGAAGRP